MSSFLLAMKSLEVTVQFLDKACSLTLLYHFIVSYAQEKSMRKALTRGSKAITQHSAMFIVYMLACKLKCNGTPFNCANILNKLEWKPNMHVLPLFYSFVTCKQKLMLQNNCMKQ